MAIQRSYIQKSAGLDIRPRLVTWPTPLPAEFRVVADEPELTRATSISGR